MEPQHQYTNIAKPSRVSSLLLASACGILGVIAGGSTSNNVGSDHYNLEEITTSSEVVQETESKEITAGVEEYIPVEIVQQGSQISTKAYVNNSLNQALEYIAQRDYLNAITAFQESRGRIENEGNDTYPDCEYDLRFLHELVDRISGQISDCSRATRYSKIGSEGLVPSQEILQEHLYNSTEWLIRWHSKYLERNRNNETEEE